MGLLYKLAWRFSYAAQSCQCRNGGVCQMSKCQLGQANPDKEKECKSDRHDTEAHKKQCRESDH